MNSTTANGNPQATAFGGKCGGSAEPGCFTAHLSIPNHRGKAAEGRLRRQMRRKCRLAVASTSSTFEMGFYLLLAQPPTAKPPRPPSAAITADVPIGHPAP